MSEAGVPPRDWLECPRCVRPESPPGDGTAGLGMVCEATVPLMRSARCEGFWIGYRVVGGWAWCVRPLCPPCGWLIARCGGTRAGHCVRGRSAPGAAWCPVGLGGGRGEWYTPCALGPSLRICIGEDADKVPDGGFPQ